MAELAKKNEYIFSKIINFQVVTVKCTCIIDCTLYNLKNMFIKINNFKLVYVIIVSNS